jgi:hypothetical protein
LAHVSLQFGKKTKEDEEVTAEHEEDEPEEDDEFSVHGTEKSYR